MARNSTEKTGESSRVKKLFVGIVGGAVFLAGLVAIPYPGPGWLIVFAGLGILSTEFEWAQRALDTLKARYDTWQSWIKRQPGYIKAGFWLLTFAVVIATIWLLNGYGLINDWFDLDIDWLHSPLFAK